ncbi:MAG TPA: ankyrin repeat domain-containing protein [Burkholderiales bacterium]|nr:ankyrin repeat domain-containing protein [Burkholderiales bacterium]
MRFSPSWTISILARRALASLAALLPLFISLPANSEQPRASAEEQRQFDVIFDALQTNSSPEAISKGYELVAEFRKAYPQSPYPLIALGEVKFREWGAYNKPGSLEEATALAFQAIKMNDQVADAYILLTNLYVEKKDGTNALQVANRAIVLEPKKPEALHAMGRAMQQNRRFQVAADFFDQAADAFVNPIRKSNMYMWVYHALSDPERIPSERRADVQRMAAALEKSIRLDASGSAKKMNYGCFLVETKGDIQEGRKYLELGFRSGDSPTRDAGRCYSLAAYLEWSLSAKNGNRAALDKIALETGMSLEDAFVESAAFDGLTPIAEAMLRYRIIANLNTIGSGTSRFYIGCCSALVNAAFNDNLPLLKKILEAGANIHAEDQWARTALFYAIFSADVEMVEYLLDQGARPNVRDKSGSTPLHICIFSAQSNQIAMMRALLRHQANPLAPTSAGPALAFFAVGTTNSRSNPGLDRLEMLKAFIADGHVGINAEDTDGLTFLAVAVYDSNQVRYLLDNGANPMTRLKGKDIVEFYGPILQTGFRDWRSHELERSLQMIRDARKGNVEK